MHDGCGEPHLKRALPAAQNGGRANKPADERWLGIGAKRHFATPQPVLRLIDKKVGAVEGEPEDAQGSYEDNRRKRECQPLALSACPRIRQGRRLMHAGGVLHGSTRDFEHR